jgi:aconitate hydratase
VKRRAHHGAVRRLDHHRPHLAGRQIKETTPAGQWLLAQGVLKADFNSYGARRGNHEVMMRGTFANVRIKNLMLPPRADGARGGRLHAVPARGSEKMPSTTPP